jgi:hypothetical protein
MSEKSFHEGSIDLSVCSNSVELVWCVVLMVGRMDGNTSLQRCFTFDILLPYGCGDLALACANRKFLLMRYLSDDLGLAEDRSRCFMYLYNSL